VAGSHAPGNGPQPLTFEAFGVRVRVVVSGPEELERVRALLPPGSQPCRSSEGVEATFSLGGDAACGYELSRDGDSLVREVKLNTALEALERVLRALVALKAPAHIFVHAGVVGHKGGAIVMPGSSLAGKTSLVAALVRAGARYYSDEFAPLDAAGLVHPFAKPLSIRNERYVQVDHHVDALGGVAGDEPLPVRAVVVTSYESGGTWRPRRLSSGEAVLAVLAHTVPAQSRPAQALETISRSLDRAAVYEGTRGEAEELAPLLLTELERARAC
jgi:hypothetical protein